MDWDAISAIGESIGAIGVIISLIYVGVQVKQNAGVTRSLAIQQWASVSALEKSAVFSDASFAAIIEKGYSNFEDLTSVEKIRFRLYIIQLINSYELLYFQWRNHTISAPYFASHQDGYLEAVAAPGVRQIWADLPHDPEFRSYVEGELAKLEARQKQLTGAVPNSR